MSYQGLKSWQYLFANKLNNHKNLPVRQASDSNPNII